MRKRIFLMLILSLCVADFGAFAATARRGSTPAGTAAVRSATRSSNMVVPKVKSTVDAVEMPGKNSSDSARAATKQTVKSVAARAGATQKVVQTGSKVAVATENTAVPQECQDAFYGCMDAFCMLDNASGGRCQCNDRITELDKALEEILKLDQQTYIMATEGVERIQMGEAADQIMERAKAAADKVTVADKKTQSIEISKKKIKQLDLSAWSTSIFDEDDADVFGAQEISTDVVDTFADKKGDDLYKAAAKQCVATVVTDKCKQYGSMLQLVYAQRIKSDCIAYENSLKQQKNNSQQKLLTAQKALRDAALEEFNDQNKYADSGSCALAFAQCMQNEAGCGSDYTGCVTLAAKENVRNNTAGTKAKQTTIKGVVSGADITLAASTMESLLAKKEICQNVVKQCVNANKNDAVWNVFLRNAAPALKSAEEIAEQNLRMQCIPTVAECYKEACKSTIDPNDQEGSYDMCLSNPATYKSLCKVQLEPCLEATGGSYNEPEKSSLWNGLIAALKSMKVDACTKQITTCLKARCNDDYSGCIGLDTETIGDLCPVDKLTACVSDGNYADGQGGTNTKAIRDYIAEIAQGLSVQIDNNMLTTCQKALDNAMKDVCGDINECSKFALDKNIGATSLKYQVCQVIVGKGKDNDPLYTVNEDACKDSAEQITKQEMGLDTLDASTVLGFGSIQGGSSSAWSLGFLGIGAGGRSDSQLNVNFVRYSNYTLKPGEVTMYSPILKGTINWGSQIDTVETVDQQTGLKSVAFQCKNKGRVSKLCTDENIKNIIDSLNNSINRMIKSVEADTEVQYCMTGRSVQATDGTKFGTGKSSGEGTGARFPNLTSKIRQTIANRVYSTAINNYNQKLAELEQKRDEDYLTLSSKYEQVAAENDEKKLQQRLATNCQSLTRDNSTWNYKETISATYSESSKTCTKTTRTQKCKRSIYDSTPGRRTCTDWADAVEKTEQISM